MTLSPHGSGTGAVYTPRPLGRFVLDQARNGAGDLPAGRWIDPACGEGAFLLLLVDELAGTIPARDLPTAVEQSIFGVDVDEHACAAARNAVRRAVSAAAGVQPDDFFEGNVINADALSADLDVGDFQLVVGNPPYVSATQMAAIDKEHFLRRFSTAWGRLDLFALFIERGLQLLAPGGTLTFITPDKLLTSISCRPLRASIAKDFSVESIARFDRHDLFPGVSTVPCVTTIRRDDPRTESVCRWWDLTGEEFVAQGPPRTVPIGGDGEPWQRAMTSAERPLRLGDVVDRISVGLATGLNRCFVVSDDAAEAAGLDKRLLRPAVRGRDIQAGTIGRSGLQLLLPFSFTDDGASLVDLDADEKLRSYLMAFHRDLEQRHCVRVWNKQWYDLHDPVVSDIAALPKVLLPDVAKVPRFAPDDGQVVPLHSAYFIVPARDSGWDPWTLSAVLNDPEVAQELRQRAPTAKSGYRRFRAEILREVRLPGEPPQLTPRLLHAA